MILLRKSNIVFMGFSKQQTKLGGPHIVGAVGVSFLYLPITHEISQEKHHFWS